MNREEEITKASLDFSPCFEYRREIFIKGAEWADKHPASPWHSVADGDFPLKAKNNNNRIEFSVEVLVRLDKNRLAFGRYYYAYKSWYVGLQRVYPTHWMEMPELPNKGGQSEEDNV